jgi:hypothetical protein
VLPGGGVLEYRHVGIGTPFLLYSSSGHIREPLDFVEAVGGRRRRSCFGAATCVTLYASATAQQSDYMIGLDVTVGGASGNDRLCGCGVSLMCPTRSPWWSPLPSETDPLPRVGSGEMQVEGGDPAPA